MVSPEQSEGIPPQQESPVPGTVQKLEWKRDPETIAAITKAYAEFAAIIKESRRNQAAAMFRQGDRRYRAA